MSDDEPFAVLAIGTDNPHYVQFLGDKPTGFEYQIQEERLELMISKGPEGAELTSVLIPIETSDDLVRPEMASGEMYLIYSVEARTTVFLSESFQGVAGAQSGTAELVNLRSGQALQFDLTNGEVQEVSRIDHILAASGNGFTMNPEALADGDLTWNECMDIAVTSCASDWQCTILCGLTFKYCVSAMAIACAVTVM